METVEVFLSTYNGEKYLKEQIDSILNQKGVKVKLSVRDDGSTDQTVEILREYEKHNLITLYTGENLYLTKSFFELVNKSDKKSEYYAFSDQDDFWEENKLSKAIEQLHNVDANKPALYYSALKIVDAKLNFIKILIRKNNEFSKALLINEVAGCTMVFNKAVLLLNNNYNGENARMHDHWFYLLCRGAGGYVYYDRKSYILYRQHGNNTVGGVKNYQKRISILKKSMINKPNERLKQIIDYEKVSAGKITSENQDLIVKLMNYQKSIWNKLNVITDKRFRLKGIKEVLLIGSILCGKF